MFCMSRCRFPEFRGCQAFNISERGRNFPLEVIRTWGQRELGFGELSFKRILVGSERHWFITYIHLVVVNRRLYHNMNLQATPWLDN